MAKFSVGDVIVLTRRHHEGVVAQVVGWRGGGVAPYSIRILEGDYFYKTGKITYMSGRDMELKEMQGKKKVWCCHQGCNTYSFEDKGTLKWECYKHYPNKFNCGGEVKEPECDGVSLEEKVDLILNHLGLEVTVKPAETALTEKPKSDG